LVLQDRFDAEEALRLIEKERVTILVGVPTQTIKMLSVPDFNKYNFDSLRIVISAGSYLPYETAKEIIHKMEARLVPIFGSHDGGTICIGALDLDEETVCRTVGRPLPDTELKIVGFDGNEVRRGEVGEFLYRSGNSSVGYFCDLEATKMAWDADGYFHSGDLGRLTEEGIVEVRGRVKDIIIRGGQNINPEEIEDILIDHPDIENVAIVGMPDPILGERCCAYVAPKRERTFTFEQMSSFLKDKDIAIYKIPERLELIDEIPISEGSKPKKDLLKRDILNKLKEEGVIQDSEFCKKETK
jgi:non-ribosomal peptide synthetase component E (peptide arylation enzyme)